MKKIIIRSILKVFAAGGSALLMAATAGLMGYLAFVLFFHIPNISGYLAVGAFIGAVIALCGALGVVYMAGCWIIRKGKFGR